MRIWRGVNGRRPPCRVLYACFIACGCRRHPPVTLLPPFALAYRRMDISLPAVLRFSITPLYTFLWTSCISLAVTAPITAAAHCSARATLTPPDCCCCSLRMQTTTHSRYAATMPPFRFPTFPSIAPLPAYRDMTTNAMPPRMACAGAPLPRFRSACGVLRAPYNSFFSVAFRDALPFSGYSAPLCSAPYDLLPFRRGGIVV